MAADFPKTDDRETSDHNAASSEHTHGATPIAAINEHSHSRIIAIGGGKGGIGKSMVATMLGVDLASRGLRVVLVDCDLGGPNLHSLLAIPFPKETLSDFILRRVDSLDQLLIPTPISGLKLISGARNAIQVANPMHQQKLRLMRAVQTLPADVAILDLGAGTHFNVVDFFLLAHHGILVIVPEPTSVENAYRFLKASFLRRIRAANLAEDIKEALQTAAKEKGLRSMSPVDLVHAVGERDPAAGAELERDLASFTPMLVVNQVRENKDITLGEGVCVAAEKLFGLHLSLLGHVHHSELAVRAIRNHLPLIFENLGRDLAKDISSIGNKILALPSPDPLEAEA